MLFAFIGRFITLCARHAWAVVALFLVLSGASVYAGMTSLGVTTDTSKMLSPRLEWKQRSDEMGRLFPQKENLLVAVIELTCLRKVLRQPAFWRKNSLPITSISPLPAGQTPILI